MFIVVILSLFHHCMGQIINYFKVLWSLDWEKPHPETLDLKLMQWIWGWLLGVASVVVWLISLCRSQEESINAQKHKSDWSRTHSTIYELLCVCSPASLVGWGHVTGFWPLDVDRITPSNLPALSSSAVVTVEASGPHVPDGVLTRWRKTASHTLLLVWAKYKHLWNEWSHRDFRVYL